MGEFWVKYPFKMMDFHRYQCKNNRHQPHEIPEVPARLQGCEGSTPFATMGAAEKKQLIWHLESNLGLAQIGGRFTSMQRLYLGISHRLYHSAVSVTSVGEQHSAGAEGSRWSVGFYRYISATNRCHCLLFFYYYFFYLLTEISRDVCWSAPHL